MIIKGKFTEIFIFILISTLNLAFVKTNKNHNKTNYKFELNNLRKLQIQNKSLLYLEVCVNKNYSYELMEYIDPLSVTLSEFLNYTFIKNKDSSVNKLFK